MGLAAAELGFVGVGKIGLPMAKRLLDAGYRLRVFDVNSAALERAVELGARAESSPAAVASAVETVLVSLPTPGVVKEVVSGAHGVIHGRAMKTLIDLSTTGPRVAKEAAALGVPMTVGNAVREAWQAAVEQIGGNMDSTTFVHVLERITGVTVAARSRSPE